MKIMRFMDNERRVLFGRPADDGLREAEILDGQLFGELRRTGRTAAVCKVLPPVEPPNIFCIGLNYREHAKEAKMDIPERPVLFLKSTNTVTGHESPVTLPSISYQVDWEGELAIIVGKPALNVPESKALDYVFGYTCANDVSARDWQLHLDKQWCRGKSFDGFCPLGPVVTTTDEISDPGNLSLTTKLNGATVQESNTCDLIFGVAHIVSYLSQATTLVPGTVILTGTPPGTGVGMNPPKFLRPADLCEVEIAGIGRLVTPFVSSA